MTKNGGLVTSGPYRYWRHPIYASVIYFVRIPSTRQGVGASFEPSA